MENKYWSDLHLEFPENKNFRKEHPVEQTREILLLAGNVLPFALMDKHKDFFSYVSGNFKLHTGYRTIMSIIILMQVN